MTREAGKARPLVRLRLLTANGTENYITDYTYDAANRLLTAEKTAGSSVCTTAYTYAPSGNLLEEKTAEHTVTYAYDRFDRQTQVKAGGLTYAYTYSPQGIRTSKTVGESRTDYLLDGGQVVAEVQGDAVSASYLWGINLISRQAGGAAVNYLYNAHGDVIQLADSTGKVTRNYDYDAFGNEKTPSDADLNPFRYCGEYFDRETGTYYLRARCYDPVIGRFTQQDTYKGDYNDPLSLNLYTYCRNNPVIYIDPSGHFFEGLGAGIKSGIRSVIHGADNMASNKWNLDTAAAGAAFLQMEQDSSGVYHATFDCWQAYFGYTDAYDFFFDLGTSMAREKFPFVYEGQNYIIWTWKVCK